MKIIVTTCNEYLHILKGFVYMFNEHWSSSAEVTVLGYNSPSYDLPNNFKFVSLGKQDEYGNEWTTALIPYFRKLSDEYFILLFDDTYILSMEKSLMYEAEKHMEKGIEKVHLANYGNRLFKEEKDINFYIQAQDARYRLSLQPCFIRRDYFLKYLIPRKTVWQYEINHEISKNDGAQILISKQNIVSYSNFMRKRKTDSVQISKIRKEDLNVLKQLEVS